VPGIINAHGHVGPARAIRSCANMRSMASPPDQHGGRSRRHRRLQGQAKSWRPASRAHSPRQISLHDASRQWFRLQDAEAARQHVDEIATTARLHQGLARRPGRADTKLSREFVAAVLDQARKHGKLTMAHIVELADARMAVDEGVNMLVHNVRDQDIPADFLATLKARNVSVISTLARRKACSRCWWHA